MNKILLIFFAFFVTLLTHNNHCGSFFPRTQGSFRLTIGFISQAPNAPFTIDITANNVKDLRKKYKLILDNTLSAYLCLWTRDTSKHFSSFENFYSEELIVDPDIELPQEDPQTGKKAFVKAFEGQLPKMLDQIKTNQSDQSAPDTGRQQTVQVTTPVSSAPLAHQK